MSSSFQQELAIRLGKQKARTGRINVSQVLAVPLGTRLASCAIFVEPDELVLILARKDQPTVEQKHTVRQTHRFDGQANVTLFQKAFARCLVTLRCRQVECAHEPLARWRLASLLTTHRHHTMLVGHYPLDRVLRRHTQTERFAQRVHVMHLNSLS